MTEYKITFKLTNCLTCPFFKLTSLQIAYCNYARKEIYIIDLEKNEDEELQNFENVVSWKNSKPSFCPAEEVDNENYDKY